MGTSYAYLKPQAATTSGPKSRSFSLSQRRGNANATWSRPEPLSFLRLRGLEEQLRSLDDGKRWRKRGRKDTGRREEREREREIQNESKWYKYIPCHIQNYCNYNMFWSFDREIKFKYLSNEDNLNNEVFCRRLPPACLLHTRSSLHFAESTVGGKQAPRSSGRSNFELPPVGEQLEFRVALADFYRLMVI